MRTDLLLALAGLGDDQALHEVDQRWERNQDRPAILELWLRHPATRRMGLAKALADPALRQEAFLHAHPHEDLIPALAPLLTGDDGLLATRLIRAARCQDASKLQPVLDQLPHPNAVRALTYPHALPSLLERLLDEPDGPLTGEAVGAYTDKPHLRERLREKQAWWGMAFARDPDLRPDLEVILWSDDPRPALVGLELLQATDMLPTVKALLPHGEEVEFDENLIQE